MIRIDKKYLEYDNNFLLFVAGLQVVGKYTTVRIMGLTSGVNHTKAKELMGVAADMGLVVHEKSVYRIIKQEPINYISISESDYEVIVSKCKKSFKHFCYLMESRCKNTDHIITEPYTVGFMPREFFAKKEGVSSNSISTYNAELENAGVVYFKRYRQMTAVYGRPKDKILVDKYAKYRLELDKIHNMC